MGDMQPKPDTPQFGFWAPSNVVTEGGRKRVYLLPGNLHVSTEPCQITTILGSCVSICLWDKRRRAGGMNHFLLPASAEDGPTSSRFADVATQMLLEQLRALDAGMRIRVALIGQDTVAVDTPEDIAKVELHLRKTKT